MKEIRSHTSLRGIAAILVTYYHIDLNIAESIKSRNITMFIENSIALVDLFFVLSGFIMAHVYWRVFSESIARKDCINFFIARFSRVYPLHIATLSFMLIIYVYSQGTHSLINYLGDVFENVFLIHAWGGSDAFIFNFPSWSVSVEVFAYILFPFVIFAMRFTLGSVFLAFLLLIMYSYMFFDLGTFHVDEKLSLIRGVPSFILGIFVFRLKKITAILSNHLISTIQLSSLVLIVAIMHFDRNVFLLLFLFPVLVLSLWEDRGALASILDNRFLVYFGALSYSIYLLHVPVMTSMFFVFAKLNLNVSALQKDSLFIAVVLLVTVIGAILTYHLFEKPSRDTLKVALQRLFFGVKQKLP